MDFNLHSMMKKFNCLSDISDVQNKVESICWNSHEGEVI